MKVVACNYKRFYHKQTFFALIKMTTKVAKMYVAEQLVCRIISKEASTNCKKLKVNKRLNSYVNRKTHSLNQISEQQIIVGVIKLVVLNLKGNSNKFFCSLHLKKY